MPLVEPGSDIMNYLSLYATTDVEDAPVTAVFDENRYNKEIEEFRQINDFHAQFAKENANFEEVLKHLINNIGIAVQTVATLKIASNNKLIDSSNQLLFTILKNSYNHYSPLFDHEEIGSNSKQGAASIMLHDMLRRILRNMDLSENEIDESIYDAMLLSVDVAHALHPNKKQKMDITNMPVMGKGFCIKQACSQSYATDAQAIAILCQLCDEKGIPYQRFVNRSDSRGGSTLGSIAGTLLPVKTVDIGIPILAMHSACELMGVRDMKALSDCVTAFFGYLGK